MNNPNTKKVKDTDERMNHKIKLRKRALLISSPLFGDIYMVYIETQVKRLVQINQTIMQAGSKTATAEFEWHGGLQNRKEQSA